MTPLPDPAAPAASRTQTPQPTASEGRDTPLFTQHTTLVLVVAVIIGGSIGALTFWKTRSLADAALAGLGAAGVSMPVLHKLIG